ncbi:hypothetical protein T01_3772 [Trichinella spiralis]|uniref:HAT C-terminal dimerisation domain-containing protein n=1 Tax=Trichinella spiralis TaxID=6334 RepID=A0A0V1B142_TRISP|nr:hypothetical protein T01_3772 [Trichinella spiralis]
MCDVMMDSRVRWNSMLTMLRRFLEMKDCVKSALKSLSDVDNFLSETELTLISDIVNALEPVAVFVNALGRKDCSLATAETNKMTVFEAVGQRPKTLQKLYDALINVPPASCEADRSFSGAGLFVTKLRLSLKDETIDTLYFKRCDDRLLAESVWNRKKQYEMHMLMQKQKDQQIQNLHVPVQYIPGRFNFPGDVQWTLTATFKKNAVQHVLAGDA